MTYTETSSLRTTCRLTTSDRPMRKTCTLKTLEGNSCNNEKTLKLTSKMDTSAGVNTVAKTVNHLDAVTPTKNFRGLVFSDNIGGESQEAVSTKDNEYYCLASHHLDRFHGRFGLRREPFNRSTGFLSKSKPLFGNKKAATLACKESGIEKIRKVYKEDLGEMLDAIDSETAEILEKLDIEGNVNGRIEALDESRDEMARISNLYANALSKGEEFYEKVALKKMKHIEMYEARYIHSNLYDVRHDYLGPFTRFEKGDSLRRSVLRKTVMNKVLEHGGRMISKHQEEYEKMEKAVVEAKVDYKKACDECDGIQDCD